MLSLIAASPAAAVDINAVRASQAACKDGASPQEYLVTLARPTSQQHRALQDAGSENAQLRGFVSDWVQQHVTNASRRGRKLEEADMFHPIHIYTRVRFGADIKMGDGALAWVLSDPAVDNVEGVCLVPAAAALPVLKEELPAQQTGAGAITKWLKSVEEPEAQDTIGAYLAEHKLMEHRTSGGSDDMISHETVFDNVPWGLDRIDQAEQGAALDGTYDDGQLTGAGVRVYVVDDGVQATHEDFEGRAVAGFTANERPECAACVPDAGRLPADGVNCGDHGTHVASTVAGRDYGVAKGATIVPVYTCFRLPCRWGPVCGSSADIAAGLEWVLEDLEQQPAGTRGVVQRSLSGGFISEDESLLNSGVPVVGAAGNAGTDYCSSMYSAHRTEAKILVGATNSNDQLAGFSCFGACVNLLAPGVSVRAASAGADDRRTASKSGTSMAAPHVSGAVAQLLQQDPTMTPLQIKGVLEARAVVGAIARVPASTPNRLLMAGANLLRYPPPPPPSSPPTPPTPSSPPTLPPPAYPTSVTLEMWGAGANCGHLEKNDATWGTPPHHTAQLHEMAIDGGGLGLYNAYDDDAANRAVNSPRIHGWQTGNNWAARMTSALPVATAGTYTFQLRVGDADTAQLFIDGVKYLETGCSWGDAPKSVARHLPAGTHAVELRYSDDGWSDRAIVTYAGPDTSGAFVGVGTIPPNFDQRYAASDGDVCFTSDGAATVDSYVGTRPEWGSRAAVVAPFTVQQWVDFQPTLGHVISC